MGSSASKHPEDGWPAYLSRRAVRDALHRFAATKSVLGTRVRFRGEGGGWVEYAAVLPGGDRARVVFQRVDREGRPPVFPAAMARWELPAGGDVPHEVVATAPGKAWVRSGEVCAAYADDGGGWVKTSEWRGAAPPVPPQPPEDTMWEYLFECYETGARHRECYRLGRHPQLLPWRLAPFDAVKGQTIHPDFRCTYGDSCYSEECQKLLARVGGDVAGIRHRAGQPACSRGTCPPSPCRAGA